MLSEGCDQVVLPLPLLLHKYHYRDLPECCQNVDYIKALQRFVKMLSECCDQVVLPLSLLHISTTICQNVVRTESLWMTEVNLEAKCQLVFCLFECQLFALSCGSCHVAVVSVVMCIT